MRTVPGSAMSARDAEKWNASGKLFQTEVVAEEKAQLPIVARLFKTEPLKITGSGF